MIDQVAFHTHSIVVLINYAYKSEFLCVHFHDTHKCLSTHTHCYTDPGSKLRSESGAWPASPNLVNTIELGVNATGLSILHTLHQLGNRGPWCTSGNESWARFNTELTHTSAKHKLGTLNYMDINKILCMLRNFAQVCAKFGGIDRFNMRDCVKTLKTWSEPSA